MKRLAHFDCGPGTPAEAQPTALPDELVAFGFNRNGCQ
jgi:hypothetical protein